jgi:hypothetical protein
METSALPRHHSVAMGSSSSLPHATRSARRARAREDRVLGEVRELMTSERLRRLARLERAARVWVNGRAVGEPSVNAHLYESYD